MLTNYIVSLETEYFGDEPKTSEIAAAIFNQLKNIEVITTGGIVIEATCRGVIYDAPRGLLG